MREGSFAVLPAKNRTEHPTGLVATVACGVLKILAGLSITTTLNFFSQKFWRFPQVVIDTAFGQELDMGRKAHEESQLRTDNPHLALAIAWDKGWVSRAREQEATTVARTRVLGFQAWIAAQGR